MTDTPYLMGSDDMPAAALAAWDADRTDGDAFDWVLVDPVATVDLHRGRMLARLGTAATLADLHTVGQGPLTTWGGPLPADREADLPAGGGPVRWLNRPRTGKAAAAANWPQG